MILWIKDGEISKFLQFRDEKSCSQPVICWIVCPHGFSKSGEPHLTDTDIEELKKKV